MTESKQSDQLEHVNNMLKAVLALGSIASTVSALDIRYKILVFFAAVAVGMFLLFSGAHKKDVRHHWMFFSFILLGLFAILWEPAKSVFASERPQPLTATYYLVVNVFDDANSNGNHDPMESPLSGIYARVREENVDAVFPAEPAKTNGQGRVEIHLPRPGNITVLVCGISANYELPLNSDSISRAKEVTIGLTGSVKATCRENSTTVTSDAQ